MEQFGSLSGLSPEGCGFKSLPCHMTETVIRLRPLHAGQRGVVGERTRFNVLMCGRRFGKTALGIDLAVEAALAGRKVGWFAATYKILNPAFDELEAILKTVPGFKKSESERWLRVGDGEIECWSMDTPDPGRSRKYHEAILDECGMVPELWNIWNRAIRPTLADYRGGAWFLGTPKDVGDFPSFYEKGQLGETDWKSWNLPTSANPYILAEEIEAMRQEMPDVDFRREVLGENVDTGNHPIGLDHIEGCTGPLTVGPPVAFGVDLARAVDFTAYVGLDKDAKVCRLDRWKTPWGLTKGRLEADIGQVYTYADSTGVGDPVVEDLQRAGMRVKGKVFSAKVKQQMVERLIAAIQQRRITFPRGWLTAELKALRATKTAYGTRYAGPDGSDIHDDGVMALALAWNAYSDTYHVPTVKPPIESKLEGRAPHFNGKTGKFDRVDSMQALEKMLGAGQRPPLGYRPRRTW